jgi:hypothetical protein
MESSFPTAKISLVQWKSYLSEIKSIPGISCIDREPLLFVCDSSSRRTIWTFTRAGHSAHPAVSQGILVVAQVQGQAAIGIDRSGHYVSGVIAFEKWMQEFKDVDKRQVAEWQGTIKPPQH